LKKGQSEEPRERCKIRGGSQSMKAAGRSAMAHHIQCNNIAFTWRSNSDPNSTSSSSSSNNIFPKTTLTKPSRKFPFLTTQTSLSCLQPSPAHSNGTRYTTLPVETSYEHQKIRDLLEKLGKKNACPLLILRDDGDWTKDQFWAVVRFLKHASRSHEILQVLSILLCFCSCFLQESGRLVDP
jgi:hypothetical protein